MRSGFTWSRNRLFKSIFWRVKTGIIRDKILHLQIVVQNEHMAKTWNKLELEDLHTQISPRIANALPRVVIVAAVKTIGARARVWPLLRMRIFLETITWPTIETIIRARQLLRSEKAGLEIRKINPSWFWDLRSAHLLVMTTLTLIILLKTKETARIQTIWAIVSH